MKKLYKMHHIDYLKEFIKRHVSSLLNANINFDIQVEKHLQYFDQSQLSLLTTFFNSDLIEENELHLQLSKIGFFSKTSIYEKKAIYLEYIKNILIKNIQYNNNLIDYKKVDKLQEKILKSSYLVKRLKKEVETFKKDRKKMKINVYHDRFMLYDRIYEKEENKHNTCDPANDKSIELFFKKGNLEYIEEDKKVQNYKEVKAELNVPVAFMYSQGVRKVTIYDRIDDPNVILRRKKALYIEPSKTIDYHRTDSKRNNIETKDINVISSSKLVNDLVGADTSKISNLSNNINFESKQENSCNKAEAIQIDNYETLPMELENLANIKCDFKIYKKFKLSKFVDEIIFTNNNISVPKASKYKSFAEFRKNMKGGVQFTKKWIANRLTSLILEQDEYLSYKDAYMLAGNFKKLLSLEAYEFFYTEYVNSEDFKAAPSRRVLKKLSLNVK